MIHFCLIHSLLSNNICTTINTDSVADPDFAASNDEILQKVTFLSKLEVQFYRSDPDAASQFNSGFQPWLELKYFTSSDVVTYSFWFVPSQYSADERQIFMQCRMRRMLQGEFFMYFIQQCFICRPSDSTGLQDIGSEPRTLATWH